MSYVMRVRSRGNEEFLTPVYLAEYDVDAHGGLGKALFTRKVKEAVRFDDAATLLRVWRSQSTVRPLRDDGKPNRPLTALTVEVEKFTSDAE